MLYLIKHIKRNTFTVLLLFLYLCGYANPAIFRGLSVADGLSDLIVNDIYKDSLGYVWIGTGTTLERYDGSRLQTYTIPGGNEKLKRVNDIAETDGNNIWMGNGMGLWQLKPESGGLIHIAPDIIQYGVNALLPEETDLYIATDGGLFIYHNSKFKHILIDPNILSSANNINAITLQDSKLLWMATNNGLYSYNLASRETIAYPYTIDNKVCAYKSMALIGQNLYLGTMGQGIIQFNTVTHQFKTYLSVDCNVISSLSGDGEDILYVATDGNGIHFISTLENKIIQSYCHNPNQSGSIRSNSVYSLLIDREGLIWVGFYQLGLDYTLYQNENFKTYQYPPYFDSHNMPVRTVTKKGEQLLIGSRDGLFFIDESAKIFKSFKTPKLRSNMIMSSCEYQGKYYVGTYGGGMYIFDPSTLEINDFDNSDALPFLRGQIFCIKSDPEGNLWIGTSQGLYQYKDGLRINHFTSVNSKLPEGNVYEIYFDTTRKGWICTENGMCIWDPSSGSLKTEIFPEGFIHKEKIRVVYEDSNNELYFLPDKGNMCISDLSMNRFRRLAPNTLLEGKDGMFIIEDKDDWLWIGTNNGLLRYDKNDLFIPYNFIDGIPSSIFTLCPPVSDDNGRIWMGNSKGLIYMDPMEEEQMKYYPYSLAITHIFVDGKESVPIGQSEANFYEVTLEPYQRNLTIAISGFIYTDPSQMSFEYRMDKTGDEWQILSGKHDLTFYNLSRGTHLLQVRYIGDTDSEINLKIHIAYPFWTWLLYLGALILLVLAGIIYYRRKKNIFIENPAIMKEVIESDEIEKQVEEKYKTNKTSPEECKRLTTRLSELMQNEKPYTNPELKIADLAHLMHTSAHTLSYIFNQHLNCSYYDYINDYRIERFKELIQEETYSRYTLSALAELCGFSSRASFFRYFKKATGITPNEYIRSMGKTNE